ncbi:MAG: hypothetical protein GX109_04100 [Bacteroidales bacterium]|nr:hypothetical protein [Bacteroidales bacterium]
MVTSEARNESIRICAYFFDVLIAKFLEFEKAAQSQSGILSIFKKINYMDRVNAFSGLLERAIEARDELSLINNDGKDAELSALLMKLTECCAIYINMAEAQVEVNKNLNRKVQGEKYNWGEYSANLESFNMYRKSMESELPKLQSLYASMLTSDKNSEDSHKINHINEKALAEIVVSNYQTDLVEGFSGILENLQDMGFDMSDLENEKWIRYDIFLCGMTIDSMALFNLLDTAQANRIYKYISFERLLKLENVEQRDYSINEMAEYKKLWDKATNEVSSPFDYVFS